MTLKAATPLTGVTDVLNVPGLTARLTGEGKYGKKMPPLAACTCTVMGKVAPTTISVGWVTNWRREGTEPRRKLRTVPAVTMSRRPSPLKLPRAIERAAPWVG